MKEYIALMNSKGLFYKKGSVNEWTDDFEETLLVTNQNYVRAIQSKFGGEPVKVKIKQ